MSSRVSSLRAFHEANKDVVNKGNSYSVPPRTLIEIEGFNVRDYEDEDVKQHIRNFAEAYKRGDYVPPIVVRVEDGKLLVREGHCRRRGLILALDEGANIERVSVVEHKGDEISQNILILTSNNSLKVKPLERAEIYRRLSAWGQSPEEIALGVSKSVTHVNQYLQLIHLPVDLKNAIRKDQISPTAAIELFNQKGSSAAAAVNVAIATAKKNGRERVTSKHFTTGPRITKQVAVSLAGQIERLSDRLAEAVSTTSEGALVSIQLSIEEAKEILNLRAKLQSPKAAESVNDNLQSQGHIFGAGYVDGSGIAGSTH